MRHKQIIRNARGTSPTSSSLEVHQQGEHDLQIETLMDMDLTVDELEHVISLENDSNASALIGSWFDSKRQVALTVAGGYLAGTVAAFIGDVTIVGTAHGIFSGNFEMSAVASLTALTAACGLSALYYLRKVREIANRSFSSTFPYPPWAAIMNQGAYLLITILSSVLLAAIIYFTLRDFLQARHQRTLTFIALYQTRLIRGKLVGDIDEVTILRQMIRHVKKILG